MAKTETKLKNNCVGRKLNLFSRKSPRSHGSLKKKKGKKKAIKILYPEDTTMLLELFCFALSAQKRWELDV